MEMLYNVDIRNERAQRGAAVAVSFLFFCCAHGHCVQKIIFFLWMPELWNRLSTLSGRI